MMRARSGAEALVFTRTVQAGEDIADLAITGFDPRGASIGPVSSFAPQQTFAAGEGPTSVAAADLDGDGKVEILDGNRVYSSTGALKWVGADSMGGGGIDNKTSRLYKALV